MDRSEFYQRIAARLARSGAGSEAVDTCICYIKGERNSLTGISNLPEVDFRKLSYQEMNEVRKEFEYIWSRNEEPLMERYLEIFTTLGKASVFYVLPPQLGNFNIETIMKLPWKSKIHVHFICWCAESVVNNGFSLKSFINKYLNEAYIKNEAAISEAFSLCEVNPKLFIAGYLAGKDPRKYYELRGWAEKVTQNSLHVLLGKPQQDEAVEMALKYINGGLFVRDSLVMDIAKKVNPEDMDSGLMHLFLGVALFVFEQSKLLKRFTKMVILLNYNAAFNALYDITKGPSHVEGHMLAGKDVQSIIAGLGVPEEMLIAWMADRCAQNEGEFRKELMERAEKNTNAVKKAAEISNGLGSTYLYKLLLEKESDQEGLRQIEDSFIEVMEKFFIDLNIPKQVYTSYLEYFRGTRPASDIRDSVNKLFARQSLYYYYYENILKKLSWLKKISPLYLRGIRFFVYSGHCDIVTRIIDHGLEQKDRDNFHIHNDIIKNAETENEWLVTYAAEYASGQLYGSLVKPAKEYISGLVKSDWRGVANSIPYCSANTRVFLLEELFKNHNESGIMLLIEYMQDSSKAVRDKAIELVGNSRKGHDTIIALLKDKKQAVRECAVHILSIWNDEISRKALEEAYNEEKSEKIKGIIANILKMSPEAGTQGDINIIDYCRSALKKTRGGSISWVDFASLPRVRYKDMEEAADGDILKYLAVSYSIFNNPAANPEAQRVSRYLNSEDLASFAYELLNLWLENGAEAKKKWVLGLAAVHGDDRSIMLIKKKIEEWPQNSRGAIACDAVYALALNGGSMALMIVDNISRKFKFRQVKEAAAGAFSYAAQQLLVDPEELSDKIVPNLGFGKNGERTFDYGKRTFIVRLSPSLELEIYDENEKELKTLPAPGKNDDEPKAKAALEEFKLLKKQLKSVTDIQAIRLELALASNRNWTVESWKSLFVENPIMQKFATGLIWGAYTGDTLESSFRYMEDGTFNTMDEEEYNIADGASIGLVHPVELQEDQREKWKTQLSDYEVKQPFVQISRKIFQLQDGEGNAKNIVRFAGTVINGLSILGKLTKYGWYKGSVQDGGCYYDFYKENPKLGLGAELKFSGVGVGNENEDVTVFELAFYTAGSMKRGSYVYDTVKESNLVLPKDVPGKFFSEILYDVDRATAAKTGMDENWAKKR